MVSKIKTKSIMNGERIIVAPGFFGQTLHLSSIEKYQEAISTAEGAINFVSKKLTIEVQSRCFAGGTPASIQQLFDLRELKSGIVIENETDLQFTDSSFIEALIKKAGLRSLTNQSPASTTYHLHVPSEHVYFSKSNDELKTTIDEISKQAEPFGFSFQFANRRYSHDLCISAVYYYDKPNS